MDQGHDFENEQYSCLRCGGQMIEGRLQTPGIDRQLYLHLFDDENFHGTHDPVLVAWICEDCGKVEIFAR